MIKVAITGGIGAGKSTVSKIFEVLEVPVYYADYHAKRLMAEDKLLMDEIKNAFGEESYNNEELNRSYLASQVFSDKSKLEKLNEIVHPAVGRDFQEWLAAQETPYIIKEVAILFESGMDKGMDKIICVSAPKDLRIERVTSRDKVKASQVEDRMNNQFSQEKVESLSDYVIANDGSKSLIEQVMEIHETLIHG